MPSRWYLLWGLVLPTLSPWPPTMGHFLTCSAALVLVVYLAHCLGRCSIKVTTVVIVLMGIAISVIKANEWRSTLLPASCWREPLEVTGRIATIPHRQPADSDGVVQRFDLEVDQIRPVRCSGPKRLRLQYWQAEPLLSLGAELHGVGHLRPSASQFSVGAVPDQVTAMATGITTRGTVTEIRSLNTERRGLTALRHTLLTRIDGAAIDDRLKGVMMALLVGHGGAVTADDWTRIRGLGLSHVLVISGLHVGLVFALVFWAVLRCLGASAVPVPGGKGIALTLALIVAALYAGLAGFSLPTQRALFMLTGWVLPTILGWRPRASDSLLFAVLLVMVLDPFAWLSSGFWLSVVATALLLGFDQWRRARGLGSLLSLLLLQCSVAVGTLPLALFWYREASVVGVVANLLLVPPLTVMVVPLLLFGALIALLFPAWTNSLWDLAGVLLSIWLAVLDLLWQQTQHYAQWQTSMSLYALLIIPGLILCYRCTRCRWLLGGMMLLSVPMASAPIHTIAQSRLVVLDVAQGLSVIWQSGGRTLVFDTGAGMPERFSQADKIILPWLSREGVDALDLLVVSHGDNDHSGGVASLKNRLAIGEHWGYGGDPCRAGRVTLWPDGTRLSLLNEDGIGGGGVSSNTASCVLMIEHRGVRLLLTGDVTRDRERDMVRYWRHRLTADVLVVAHHGSDTSTSWTFLKWVRPELALISSARASRFGHPSPRVVERLRQSGAKIIDTAQAGSVTVNIQPKGGLQVRQTRQPWHPFWLQFQ